MGKPEGRWLQHMLTIRFGGGVGSGEDNLFKFIFAFNMNADYQFGIGKQVFDHNQYRRLVELRHFFDPNFTGESGFFPLYRS